MAFYHVLEDFTMGPPQKVVRGLRVQDLWVRVFEGLECSRFCFVGS